MWKLITDCQKQIEPNSKIREINGEAIKEYNVVDIESDLYHIQLIKKDGAEIMRADESIGLKFYCTDILKYKFEILIGDE